MIDRGQTEGELLAALVQQCFDTARPRRGSVQAAHEGRRRPEKRPKGRDPMELPNLDTSYPTDR